MSGKYAFSQTLKEVRFLFCQTAEHSGPTRWVCASHLQSFGYEESFLARAYPTMKKNNPHTPIMIREAAGTQPRVYARYEFGKEKSESLAGLSDKEIEDKVTGLVKTGI
ncbi:NADH-ubiquinone oxidoreductase [Hyphodiscus hymeniophilus]|uniref:NADH-ubiquinone oxidoreductase n=1 Tax=Hyphodiscus hymeniophilus TaxID=353542 RepID=A0A9P6SQQ2_9HELO|nr:NADH-ubiquinone oxidoreductase [Hyphodiscus hymeniophilus]